MNHALICTKCDTVLLKSMDNEIKLRCKMLIFKGDTTYAVCKGCGAELPVPVAVNIDMVKSISKTDSLKLYVKK